MKRRSLLLGLGAALAAPAIVRAESIMRVASLRQTTLAFDLATGAPSDYFAQIIGIALEKGGPGEVIRVMLSSEFGNGIVKMSNTLERVYPGDVTHFPELGLVVRGEVE